MGIDELRSYHLLYSDLGHALNPFQFWHFSPRDKRYGYAGCSCATGSADPMEVGIRVSWHIVVNDV